jgi:hypothetical protein
MKWGILLTSTKSASSAALLDSSAAVETDTGLIAVLRPARAFRAFFVGVMDDFSIRGVERHSRKSWKLELSFSSSIGEV